MADDLNCGSGGGSTSLQGLRIASIFVIWVGSTSGALFPVLAKRTKWLNVPIALFDFAKYFGSGVIIATAFIHLLSPALDALGSPCLADGWSDYPYALAISMGSIFFIFIIELLAFRVGTAQLKRLGVQYDVHGHGVGGHSAHGPEARPATSEDDIAMETASEDVENQLSFSEKEHAEGAGHVHTHGRERHDHTMDDSAIAQVLGVAILEFGVMLHSVLIGLTLAVDPDFKVLFVVLVFHQTFEGLGLGSRLAFMHLPPHLSWVPVVAAMAYGITTPVGIAAGLGVRSSYNPGSTRASIISGVLDATSSGILIYTGLVELLAHEFLFNPQMREASNGRVAYAVACMLAGCALMALLGKWV
ncbi:ZIP-like iron-zinc transporter [Amylostereum chailletii]|nr:ZIP-like iron-zinc transporter [Amylostereum chailletii]